MKLNLRVIIGILLIPASLFTIIHLHLHSRYLIYGDEAEYMNNAWRVYMGGRPYKDFWLLFSPGEVYFPAFIFSLLGVNLNIILISNMLVSMLVMLFVFLILKELKCSWFYALIASFLFILLGYFMFFTLLCLAACYFILLYDKTNKRSFLLISGFITGLALLLRIYQVAPFCIAGFVFLLMRKQSSNKLRDVLLFTGMAAIPVIVTILLLYSIRIDMFNALVVDAPSHGTSMNIPYWHKMAEAWDKMIAYINFSTTNPKEFPVRGLFFMSSDFLFAFFERVVPFVAGVCFVFDIIGGSVGRSIIIRRLMFIIWGVLYSPYAFNLSGHEHIIQAYVPFLLLFYEYGYEIIHSRKNAVLKFLFLPFVAIVILNSTVQLYDSFKPSYVNPYELKTATGKLYIEDKETYYTMQGIVNTIDSSTVKGEYIFSLCWNTPSLYALTERQDPTYYDSPIDLLIRPAPWKEENIIHDLSRTKTRLVIIQTEFPIRDGLKTGKALPLLLDYVNTNYSLYRQYPLYDVYRLK